MCSDGKKALGQRASLLQNDMLSECLAGVVFVVQSPSQTHQHLRSLHLLDTLPSTLRMTSPSVLLSS